MEPNIPNDPVELLTATPASIRRLNELTLILREQLPAAMDRLETDARAIQEATGQLSQVAAQAHITMTSMQETVRRLTARADASLTQLSEGHQKTLTRYSRAVTILLVSQAALIGATVLMLWIKR